MLFSRGRNGFVRRRVRDCFAGVQEFHPPPVTVTVPGGDRRSGRLARPFGDGTSAAAVAAWAVPNTTNRVGRVRFRPAGRPRDEGTGAGRPVVTMQSWPRTGAPNGSDRFLAMSAGACRRRPGDGRGPPTGRGRHGMARGARGRRPLVCMFGSAGRASWCGLGCGRSPVGTGGWRRMLQVKVPRQTRVPAGPGAVAADADWVVRRAAARPVR